MSKPVMKPKRECGECSLCCKVFDVEEVVPPTWAGDWCSHCRPGQGCSIYGQHPATCKDFYCLWLLDTGIPDHWQPHLCHMIIAQQEGHFIITVDPDHPDVWEQEPYYKQIKYWAHVGLQVKPVRDFIVQVKDRFWHVLPDKDIEITPIPNAFKRRGL